MGRTTDDDGWFQMELRKARAYSRALRHMAQAGLWPGLEPLTFDEEACEWDGPLLPLESIDRTGRIRIKTADEIDHGTERGYQQHRRFDGSPCERCAVAHREHNQEQKQARKARRVA